MVAPEIEFTSAGSESDGHSGQGNHNWLGYEVRYTDGAGLQLPAADIQRLLRGGGTKQLPDGRTLALDRESSVELATALSEIEGPDESISPADADLLARFSRSSNLAESLQSVAPDPAEIIEGVGDLWETLRPYQQDGVQWIAHRLETSGGALLADEMGLGKTLQTLAYARYLRATQDATSTDPVTDPVLVVCPRTLLGNWQAEAARFTPEMESRVYHGPNREDRRDEIRAADLVLTTYGILAAERAFFGNHPWSLAVLDEASYIRNPKTEAAKAARVIQAGQRLALSGTPLENSPTDAWSLMEFLQPGFLGTQADFNRRYLKPLSTNPPDPATHRRFTNKLGYFTLQRKKESVAPDLPEKLIEIDPCLFSRSEEALYQQILSGGLEAIAAAGQSGGPAASRMQMLTVLLRLRQVCCDPRLVGGKKRGAKADRLLELAAGIERGGHRALVFSQFAGMLRLLESDLESAGIATCYLDGSTQNREKEVARFRKSPEIPVFLISLKAGGYGLNLTEADTVVHYDPWWNPAVEAQATDRAHRIGQERPVSVHKFMVPGTVEEEILRLQDRKRGLLDALIDERAPLMGGLSSEELEGLLDSFRQY